MLTPELVAKNVESFEVVWKTVRDRHFDPKLGGINWQAVHDELRPKVERAKTMADARAAMTAAVERLGQTHFEIIPSGLYEDLENPNEGPGVLGLDIRLLDGRVVVTEVKQGHARSRRRASNRDGSSTRSTASPSARSSRRPRPPTARSGLVAAYKTIAVIRRLHGRVGSAIEVDFPGRKGSSRSICDLTAREPIGVPATFGNLPTFYVRFSRQAG